MIDMEKVFDVPAPWEIGIDDGTHKPTGHMVWRNGVLLQWYEVTFGFGSTVQRQGEWRVVPELRT